MNGSIWGKIKAPWDRGAGAVRQLCLRRRSGYVDDLYLKHTAAESPPREALTINPAKTCQPIGAMYAALGVHRCLPHSHGSQGCCSYHRSTLTRHYKEPVMAATSSFTEGASVFGGQSNLLQAINTIFTLYDPDIIAVHTTCLSETIGDDLPQIIGKATAEGKIPAGRVRAPREYAELHRQPRHGLRLDDASLRRLLRGDYRKGSEKLAVFPGWVEPSDMAELKRLLETMAIPYHYVARHERSPRLPVDRAFRDVSRGRDQARRYQAHGRRQGLYRPRPRLLWSAAKLLDTKCRVPCDILDLPIGLSATDRFIDALRRVAGVAVSETVIRERGRLVDMMADMHQYTYGKTVAVAGDPDQLCSLSEFLRDMDMKVRYVVTGTPGKVLEPRLTELIAGPPKRANGAGRRAISSRFTRS